jgi:hypothetical protein
MNRAIWGIYHGQEIATFSPERGTGVIWNGDPLEPPVIPVPRWREESRSTKAHFQRFVEWIPAFAGMTRSRK